MTAVAAADDVDDTSQVYTIPSGETAKFFWTRSQREGLKEFKEYRALKNNVTFAIITKGTLTAICPNDVLKQFCRTQVEFKIWNVTHIILKINDTSLSDSGVYSVEHVFGGMEGNHHDKAVLKVVGE